MRKKILDAVTDAMDDTFTIGKTYDTDLLNAKLQDFEPLLLIDRNALDEAIEAQPDLLYRVGEILALQTSRRDAAKQFLANQEAIVDAHIRRTYRDAAEKATVAEVEAQKRVNTKVVAATDQLLRMNHSVMQWTNLKEAIIQRGHALRELVNLYVHSYFESSGSITASKVRERKAVEVGSHYRR